MPPISGSTPNCAGSKSGAHSVPVKKSTTETSPKNSNAGTKSATTIPTVVATEISAQTPSRTLTTSSPYRLRRAWSRSSTPAVMSVDANYAPVAVSRSAFALVSCSSVSGTNCDVSAIDVSFSSRKRRNASTSGRASASFLT